MHILLRVVRGVCKDAGEDTSFDSIEALDHDAVSICVNELRVEKRLPNSVHQFSTTVRENGGLLGFPFLVEARDPIAKAIGKLESVND